MLEETKTEGPFRERIAPLLSPLQTESLKEEYNQLEASLAAPKWISGQIQDKPMMFKKLSYIKKTMERDLPCKYEGTTLDKAKAREKELIEQITQGMPTQEEMRRNPPRAVDKHRSWESRNKAKILEWKNIRKRLLASGAIDDCPYDSVDISNIERYRQSGGAQQLSMDNAQIAGKQFYMNQIPSTVVFNDDELATLKGADPELAAMIGTLSADVRAERKTIVKGIVSSEKKTVKKDK